MTGITTVYGFMKAYINGTLGKQTKCGNWSVMNWGGMDVLQYFSGVEPVQHSWRRRDEQQTEPERVAYKLTDGSVIFNANQLTYAVHYSYGRRQNRNGNQADCQRWLEELGATPIPFTLFNEIEGADVRDFSWVLKPKKEYVKIRQFRTNNRNESIPDGISSRHFVGSCLFKIGEETFLFDIDRQELDHGIFNPFVTKLPKKAETVPEAYDLLMPDMVRKAINNKIDVKRQGEFFFIKHSDECPIKPELTKDEWNIIRHPPSRTGYGISADGERARHLVWLSDDTKPLDLRSEKLDTPEKIAFQKEALEYAKVYEKFTKGTAHSGTLGKSATGSHNVELYVEVGKTMYASGKVSQQRRQHADLMLKGWYKVVPNTGVLSWTITGKID